MITPSKRSTLQLDLKDLSPRASTPYVGRIGITVVSAVALVSTIVSINSPSASPSEMDGALKVSSRDLVPDAVANQYSDYSSATDDYSERAAFAASTDTISSNSNSKAALQSKLFAPRRNEIKLAMFAPSMPFSSPRPAASTFTQRPNPTNRIPATSKEVDRILAINPQPNLEEVDVALIDPTPADKLVKLDHDQIENNKFELKVKDDSARSQERALSEGVPDDAQQNSNIKQDQLKWLTAKVKKKDTLSQIFNRLGLSSKEAYALVKNKEAKPLSHIRPGQEISITQTDSDKSGAKPQLQHLKYKLSKFDTLLVTRTENGFEFETETREPQVRYRSTKATIWTSLLGSAKEAKIPYEAVYELASIFGWQIDFAKDIQDGDQYSVIYEELVLDDEVVGTGQVVAAELITDNSRMRAVRHVDEDGHVSYYAPDGDGIQGSFLRTPIKFGRVTSKFSNKRFHPIQKKWKAHKGVDYGAPMKTPILATGDGVVKFAGKKKGYGRTIILRHGEKYQTLYAHMNHFEKRIRSGSRVKQGEVIGYVGKSGWTTGPHLHYEFRINGRHKNPLTVELPKSASIEKKYRNQFKQSAERWVAALDDAGKIPLAALNE